MVPIETLLGMESKGSDSKWLLLFLKRLVSGLDCELSCYCWIFLSVLAVATCGIFTGNSFSSTWRLAIEFSFGSRYELWDAPRARFSTEDWWSLADFLLAIISRECSICSGSRFCESSRSLLWLLFLNARFFQRCCCGRDAITASFAFLYWILDVRSRSLSSSSHG